MTTRMIAPVLAFAALATAQGAQAQQQPCVKSADFADGVVYAMPLAFDAARTACANRLDRNGFVATRGETYIAQFRAGQDRAWPGALRLLKAFMATPDEDAANADMAAIIANLPDDALRPFVDALVGQMIAKEIKGDSCGKIERVLELISPLPTDNVGGLIAFIAEVAELKDPPICGTAAAAAPARAADK
jgi:hypothetical protein